MKIRNVRNSHTAQRSYIWMSVHARNQTRVISVIEQPFSTGRNYLYICLSIPSKSKEFMMAVLLRSYKLVLVDMVDETITDLCLMKNEAQG